MAVIRLLVVVSSSVFLLLVAGAAADDEAAYCDSTSGGSDAATVANLVKDLREKVPDNPQQRYCSVLTSASSGLQVFGYGRCSTRDWGMADPTSACRECLSAAGDVLMGSCGGSAGGAGEALGPTAMCYIKTGTSSCASMIY
ncbi:unnamed protein product [Linum trigynum]|uniref:Gnk2-homologous domain-containing protein n=1 Tax=Linum trigynum TaxID=586398 RepID=A0AAV2EHM0_9ROSI